MRIIWFMSVNVFAYAKPLVHKLLYTYPHHNDPSKILTAQVDPSRWKSTITNHK